MQTIMHTQTGLDAFHPQTLFKTPVRLGVSFYNRSFFPGCFFINLSSSPHGLYRMPMRRGDGLSLP